MLGRVGGACSAGDGISKSQGKFREAASSSLSVQTVEMGMRSSRRRRRRSACSVAAQEGVEHGQLHALLVPSTPRHHRALAVGRVEVVAVARVRQAERRQIVVRKSNGTEKKRKERMNT